MERTSSELLTIKTPGMGRNWSRGDWGRKECGCTISTHVEMEKCIGEVVEGNVGLGASE